MRINFDDGNMKDNASSPGGGGGGRGEERRIIEQGVVVQHEEPNSILAPNETHADLWVSGDFSSVTCEPAQSCSQHRGSQKRAPPGGTGPEHTGLRRLLWSPSLSLPACSVLLRPAAST